MIDKFMTWFNQELTQKRLIYIVLAGVFVLMFALNYFFPIYADDMLYSVIRFGEPVDLVNNFEAIGRFIYSFYFGWGGRIVAHIVAHILLMFNFTIQDILNSLVFVGLVFIVYKISNKGNKNNVFLLGLICLSIFYFTPSFLSSVVWITGSANYLWMTTLSLVFLYPYYKYSLGQNYNDSVLRAVAFLFFGVIAGCTNENLGPVVFLILVGYGLFCYQQEKKILPKWFIAGIVGVAIGCCIMILAPGNAVRAEQEGYPSLFSSFSLIPHKITRLWPYYKFFMPRLLILYAIFLCLFLSQNNDRQKRKTVLFHSLLFFIAANISIWITIFSPSFPPRAFFSITVLTIVSVCILYANIELKNTILKLANILLLVGMLFFSSIDYVTFLKGLYFLDKEITRREKVIEDCKAKGIDQVSFEIVNLDYRFEYTEYKHYYKDYYNMNVIFYNKEDANVDSKDKDSEK